MERQIGERFKYGRVTLEVVEAPNGKSCRDCYFLHNKKCFKSMDETGHCYFRDDERKVYFKKVKK